MLVEKATRGRIGARPGRTRALVFEREGERQRRQDPLEVIPLIRRTGVLYVVVVGCAFLDQRRRIRRRTILGLFDRFERADESQRGETPSCSGRVCAASRSRARRRRRGRSRFGRRRRRARERVVVRFVGLDVPLGGRGPLIGCSGSGGAAWHGRAQERADRAATPARRRRRTRGGRRAFSGRRRYRSAIENGRKASEGRDAADPANRRRVGAGATTTERELGTAAVLRRR
jgi:hypothetical protein